MLCVVIVVKHIQSSSRHYASLAKGIKSPSLASLSLFIYYYLALIIQS